MTIDRPVGIALVGCGRIGVVHLKAIARHPEAVRLVAVVDPDLERAQAAAKAYGAPHAFSWLAEALVMDEVEAVVLCTPNAVHAAQCEQVMTAGKHVLVEKPFSDTVADAERISAMADKTGLVLAAGHTFRHVEAVRTLQDRRESFGRLRAVNISLCVFWDGPQATWWATRTRKEGLILSLLAPHAIDFLQLVVGEVDPARIHVEAAQYQTRWRAEDEAMILLRYPNDIFATIHLSYNQRKMMNRKVIHFEKATVHIENGDELWIDDEPIVIPARQEVNDISIFNDGIIHYFETQIIEFARAVRGLPNRSVLHPNALRQVRLNRAIIEAANLPHAVMVTPQQAESRAPQLV